MTISSENRKAGPFTGNDSTTVFPFAFKVFKASDLLVVRANTSTGVESTLSLDSDYTVTLNDDQDATPGGNVTIPAALPSGFSLTATSNVASTQDIDLTNQGGFYPSVINRALDRVTIILQQLAEKVDRAVKVKISSSYDPDLLVSNLFAAEINAKASELVAVESAQNAADSEAAAAGYAASINPSLLATKAGMQQNAYAFAVAGGTADALTASFSPAIAALTNGMTLFVRAAAANTTTTPTLNVDGLGAVTIVKGAGAALVAGDIAGAGHWLELQYDSALGKFVLQNPAKGITTYATLASPAFSGTPTAPNAALGTNTQQIATMAALYAAIVARGQMPVSASVASNALTVGFGPYILDFRSSTLTSGAVNTRLISSALSLVVPSGATLGTVSGRAARLALLEIDYSGTVEMAIVNMAGGVNLDETTLISTTAISASSNSASTIYSTTARTSVPFRFVGFLDITQATAGTWATAPTLVQGAGGQAMAAMSSVGYGQTWQDVTASRALGTTYYNTTGKPIQVAPQLANASTSATITVGSVSITLGASGTTGGYFSAPVIVPPGVGYSVSYTAAMNKWIELR